MSEYKAPKRSYLELLEIFKKEIVEKPGETEDEKRTKYFAVITLQEDLKANFDYYYEYELLKLVLQDYKDVLNKKTAKTNIRVFTPTETSVTDSDDIVYNTLRRTAARIRRFGEVQINPSR